MRTSHRTTGWAGLILAVLVASCSTTNVSTSVPGSVDDQRGGSGVKLGGFEVIRYNAAGYADPSLNSTLALSSGGSASAPELNISVNDSSFTTTVALDVRYNGQSIHPDSAVFHGLLGPASQVLSASFLNQPGVASLGETVIKSYRPAALDGAFATLKFAPGALKAASKSGDVHHNTVGVAYTKHALDNLTAASDTVAQSASVAFTAAWHIADGDQNSEANIADLTPIGAHFGDNPSTDWSALPADYDDNDEVNIADLTPIGLYFGEGTTAFTIEASDDDGSGRTAVSAVDWVDAAPASDPSASASGPLSQCFKSWTISFDGASAFTYSQLAALDLNANQSVTVYVTPTRTVGAGNNGTGVEASINVSVGGTITGPANLTVTDYTVKLEGVSGGGGTNGDEFNSDNLNGAIMSNGTLTASLERISGSYASTAGTGTFDGDGAFPSDMDQADYDLAFNAVRDLLTWTVGHDGASGFRRMNDWVVFNGASPITGDPGAGDIFPDFDPDTSAPNNTEGTLTVFMPHEQIGVAPYPLTADLDVNVLADVQHVVAVDVLLDDTQPQVADVQGQAGQQTEIPLQIDTQVTVQIAWGSGGAPIDFLNTQLQLVQFDTSGLPVGAPIDFTRVDAPPTDASEYFMQDLGGLGVAIAIIPGVLLNSNGAYNFRFFDGNKWSSVNLPDWQMTTAPPPPSQDLVVVPDTIGTGRQTIQIFYEDPLVRRNPYVNVDIFNESADPLDQLAYDDILKQSGDEYFIQFVSGEGVYPKIIVIESDTPTSITPSTQGLPGPIFTPNGLQPHRICVDVLALPDPSAATPLRHFAFKLFDKNDLEVGKGTFDSAFLLPDVSTVVPVDFGVNAINHAAVDISALDFSNKTAQGNTIDGATPDVLWFEFADGWMFDYDLSAIVNNNVRAQLTRLSDDKIGTMRMDLRLAGLGSGTTYVCIHPLEDKDFEANPVIDGWPGILQGGQEYQVDLDDPTKAGIEATYVDHLFVGSDAPAPNPD